jgi:hypothetical protein
VDGDLDAARDALERGRSKQALRLAWSAATWSASCNDRQGLDEAILVAEAIRDQAKGRTREEASRLAAFCAYSRDNPQPRRWFGLTNTRV